MNELGQIFDDAYIKYYRNILRYFKGQIRYNSDVAEDLTQQTFMRLWKYLLRNIKIDNIKGLLYSIAKSVRADYFRNVKFVTLSLESCVNFAKSIDNRVDEDVLYEALEQLAKDEVEVIKLRINGYTYDDMTKILGINSSTLRSKFLIAKRKLKKILLNYKY